MLVEITNGLVQKGHTVNILMPKNGDLEFELMANLIRTRQDELTVEDFPSADVIVSNFFSTVPVSQSASLSGKGTHVRFSLCYEPMFLNDQNLTFPTYNVTHRLIVLSKYQQQLIELTHGIKGEIVPVGVNSIFRNDRVREGNKTLTISAVVRQPGGYSWHRNQDELLNALTSLKQHMPFLNIRLICPPNEFTRSPGLQDLKSQGLFTILTPADDVELNYHYNETDIFVSSSMFEAAALPALEAMRCGAAVITVHSGGNIDYAVHERNCLFSYAYEQRIFGDLIRLINDKELRTRLALQGEEDSRQWTWERSVHLFEEKIYQFLQS